MYPSRLRPDYGVFVAGIAEGLRARGHQIDLAVIRESRGGALRTPRKYGLLGLRALSLARERPDVVYAHYLVPTGVVGAAAARLARAPLVVTAHGGDVAHALEQPAIGTATSAVLRASAAVIAVSDYVARRLPHGAERVEVIDCGVDTSLFRPAPRAEGPGPRFVFVGSLTPRKNAGRLLRAFDALGSGTLTVVGTGPLEHALRAQASPQVRFTGALRPDDVRAELVAADVLVAPSLEEPQGQQVLEALACGRPVVATRVGGPAEVVTEACGALVDPGDVGSIAAGMRAAAELEVPCEAAVAAAAAHDRSLQVERIEAVLASVAGRPTG